MPEELLNVFFGGWLIKEMITSDEENLSYYEKKLKNNKDKYWKNSYRKDIKRIKESIEQSENIIKLYNGDCAGTFLEETFIAITGHEKEPNKILYLKYEGSYTVTNPMLKVKQTFNRILYTDRSGTKFVNEVELDEE